MKWTRMSFLASILWTIGLICGCGAGPEDQAGQDREDRFALDPDNYRSEIEAIEQLLYKNTPADLDDYDRASGALFQLGSKALEAEDHPRRKEKARLIMSLASQNAAAGDVGYAMPDLDAMRRGWEDVRQHVFRRADWFDDTTPALQAAQTPVPPQAAYGDIHGVKLTLDRLESLIDQGRWEVEELGEPDYALEQPGQVGRQHIVSWQEWTRQWEYRIQGALRSLPAKPGFDDDLDFFYAYQSLERAVRELRNVPHGAGAWPTPFRYQWEHRFAGAERGIAEARAHLEKSY